MASSPSGCGFSKTVVTRPGRLDLSHMPYHFDIHHDRRLVHARLEGVLSDSELFGYQQAVWSRPDVAGYDELIDASGVTEFGSFSADRFRQLAQLAARMDAPPHPSKLAIVAPGDGQFGMGRMYQIYRELETRGTKVVRVFHTCAEALEWLRTGQPCAAKGP